MFKKKHMIAALGIVSVFLGGFFFSNALLAQGSGEYDPWLDYNEDGIVDVNDLHPLGQAYGSSGDPTKNVNVTNWPVSTDTTVWYQASLEPLQTLSSGWYEAYGFGYIHIIVWASELSGSEFLRVQLNGRIWDLNHLGSATVDVYEFDLNSTSTRVGVTVPVPSEYFMFRVMASGITTVDYLFFGFYLTWA